MNGDLPSLRRET